MFVRWVPFVKIRSIYIPLKRIYCFHLFPHTEQQQKTVADSSADLVCFSILWIRFDLHFPHWRSPSATISFSFRLSGSISMIACPMDCPAKRRRMISGYFSSPCSHASCSTRSQCRFVLLLSSRRISSNALFRSWFIWYIIASIFICWGVRVSIGRVCAESDLIRWGGI